MRSFHFPSCGELVRAVRYLACFDDSIKFSLSIEAEQSLLRLCTASVPPYSYTEVLYDNAKGSKPLSCALATEEETLVPVSTTEYRQTWVIHAGLLQSVLATFDEAVLLAIELVEDASQMLLYQRDECQRRTRVAQIDVLQHLGPSLLVQHDVTLFYRVRDIAGFRQMCRAICCDDEGGCTVALQRGEGDTCDLTFSTAAVRSSVQLGYVDVLLAPAPSGSARCADLEAFGSLCRLATRDALLQLSVGFGQNGTHAVGMLSLAEAMSERHGVLIYYNADEMTPQLVDRMAHLFGQVSSSATFDLRAGGVLSVFLFAEPSAAARCYETLRFLVDEGEVRIANVGWINEDNVARLAKKPYVRARWQPSSSAERDSGYLLLLTRSLKDGETGEAVARLARGLALEVHEDDKEGGRLFMRCASEDAADEARRELVARFPQIRYAVSFIDKAEFDLATQTNH